MTKTRSETNRMEELDQMKEELRSELNTDLDRRFTQQREELLADFGVLIELHLNRYTQNLEKAKGKEQAQSSSPIPTPQSYPVRENRNDPMPPNIQPLGANRVGMPAQHFTRGVKLEFPRFDGNNPKSWVRKCSKYFLVNPLTDYEKIVLAAINMEGKADLWYQDYIEGRENMTWERFTGLVMERFMEAGQGSVIGEFNKLRQTATVAMYVEQFDELKSFMVSLNRHLTEEYFMHSFISGLKEEIKTVVQMFNPLTLGAAAKYAKLQEASLEAVNRVYKNWNKGPMGTVIKRNKFSPLTPNKAPQSNERSLPVRRLNPEEIENRRRKGTCFSCDEPYYFGHKCKKLFTIMAEEMEEYDPDPEEEEDLAISVHALAGKVVQDTIKLLGNVKNNTIYVLVDTGSTHSFVDPSVARRAGIEVEYTNPMLVTVADGNKLECSTKCTKFCWNMGNHEFNSDVRVLKLGGCDMVLAVDLMKKFGPVTFDFDRQKVIMNKDGEEVTLQGIQGEVELNRATGDASSAISYFEESVNFLMKVPKDDAEITHTLSVSLNKIGDLKYYEGDLQATQSYYFQALDVRRSSINHHSTVPSRVIDVAISLAKVADVDRNLGNEDTAVAGFQEAIKLLESLAISTEEPALEQRRVQVLEFLNSQLAKK